MNKIWDSCCLQSSFSFTPFFFEIKPNASEGLETVTCHGSITLTLKQAGKYY